ncbi:hypothetical protein SmJEL517_g03099 [Synchytrium microbalum]|uniref:Velvet domain-containing protein n=1 Tax=Synchytrium microbalum TaxID=1806994 RepID=A0A507C449_9FUNG|nr:uncharacterized protein SmJEL517_g03099 [Synchytrium microbalum]TPX34158.1 hypothetical protein SmJEL517_g03099 [Synchytrium microbalum]
MSQQGYDVSHLFVGSLPEQQQPLYGIPNVVAGNGTTASSAYREPERDDTPSRTQASSKEDSWSPDRQENSSDNGSSEDNGVNPEDSSTSLSKLKTSSGSGTGSGSGSGSDGDGPNSNRSGFSSGGSLRSGRDSGYGSNNGSSTTKLSSRIHTGSSTIPVSATTVTIPYTQHHHGGCDTSSTTDLPNYYPTHHIHQQHHHIHPQQQQYHTAINSSNIHTLQQQQQQQPIPLHHFEPAIVNHPDSIPYGVPFAHIPHRNHRYYDAEGSPGPPSLPLPPHTSPSSTAPKQYHHHNNASNSTSHPHMHPHIAHRNHSTRHAPYFSKPMPTIPQVNYENSSSSSSTGKELQQNGFLNGESPRRKYGAFDLASLFQDADVEDGRMDLQMRQNPLRARMIGFGEKDRRPIDPPPIVEVRVYDGSGTGRLSYSEAANMICHVSIWSADGRDSRSVVVNPFHPSAPSAKQLGAGEILHTEIPASALAQVLVGNLVSPCYILNDVSGVRGMFFVFPDVNVRISGTYRLKFSIFNLKWDRSKSCSPCRGTILSDPFTVWHPKEFPGMAKDSTELSKCFAKQGLRIHIRGNETGRGRVKRNEEDND